MGHDSGPHPKCGQFTVHPSRYGANVGTPFFFWMVKKAHSKVEQVTPQVAPPGDRSRLPLWHCVYLRNNFRCTHYNTNSSTGMYVFDPEAQPPSVCFATLVTKWFSCSTMAVLAYPANGERCKVNTVWDALTKSPLPEQDKDFGRVTLWRKQLVGVLQQDWKRAVVHCPIDGL